MTNTGSESNWKLPIWKSGPELMKIPLGQHGSRWPIDDRRSVNHQQRIVRVDISGDRFGAVLGELSLVACRFVGVVLDPDRAVTCPRPRRRYLVADLFLLPHDHLGVEVLNDERKLVAGLPPVSGADHCAQSSATNHQLEEA
jgi:hypothetical protein